MESGTCPRCGRSYAPGATQCSECGAPLGRAADARFLGGNPWRRARAMLGFDAAAVACAALGLVLSKWWDLALLLVPVAWVLALIGGLVAPQDVPGDRSRDRAALWAVNRLGCLMAALTLLGPCAWMYYGVFAASREREEQSATINNVRRLSVAIIQYAEDNDGHLPGWARGSDGALYHNVWDQQIAPLVPQREVFRDSLGRGIQSPSQPALKDRPKDRVLSFGLNGLLLAPAKRPADGNADWDHGPRMAREGRLARLDDLEHPEQTILLAELATDAPIGGMYGDPATPDWRKGAATKEYRRALRQWIDIDPRAWVETSGPADSYNPHRWDPERGVARDAYGGGGNYAFCDGHVQFLRLVKTVGSTGTKADPTASVPVRDAWSPANRENLWLPK